MDPRNQFDTVVIGGGPAGLQAALTLGRMHRDTLLLDSGRYRNDPADAMHNLIGHDGRKPAELRAAARGDLAAYDTVAIRDQAASAVRQDGDGFAVETYAGEIRARRIVLATGLADTLPDVPGLTDLFGSVAAHCPYCHGHEFAGTHVGLLGAGPHTGRVALLLRRITSRITVFTNGAEVDEATRTVLDRHGFEVRAEPVAGLCRSPAGATITFEDGSEEEVGGLMIAPSLAQAAPFAEQLGLELQESGCVRVDAMGRTSLAGVYAAGDLAHPDTTPMPLASVAHAIAAGLGAATAIDMDEVTAELDA